MGWRRGSQTRKASWFHTPIPTPVITRDVRTTVQRLFVLYKAENCEVRNVHVYDGSAKVQELNNLHLTGEHRTGLDGANTFDLAAPHTVLFGMGITFLVQAPIGFDTVIQTRFITATGGADFHACRTVRRAAREHVSGPRCPASPA